MSRFKSILIVFLLMLMLVSCNSDVASNISLMSGNEDLEGRVLIWHTWEGNEEVVLNKLLDKFTEIHPKVTIIRERHPEDVIIDTYIEYVASGLGPDILIAPATEAHALADQESIRRLDVASIDLSGYLPATSAMLNYNDELYGLPLSLHTMALYYNKSLVEQEPPETLAELWEQAQEGVSFALPINFMAAFWGVRAFGGNLFDEEGRVVLNQGGFANWLIWLKNVQEIPAIVLNKNSDELKRLFLDGLVDYYVGHSTELSELQGVLGAENVGVASLPKGQNNFAGPFLETEAMMFSPASSRNDAELALEVAQFLANAEQQRVFALDAGKIPVNKNVQIDRRVAPEVAAFMAQSKTAVAIPLSDLSRVNSAAIIGDDLYAQVIAGELGIGEAANNITQKIDNEQSVDAATFDTIIECHPGTLVLWHSWGKDEHDTLQAILDGFHALCPETTVRATFYPAEELPDRFTQEALAGSGPSILLTHNEWVVPFADEELILSINEYIEPSFYQRYLPNVEQAMAYDDQLYGLPVDMLLHSLYYNTDQVETPPNSLEDILTQTQYELKFGMPVNFYQTYWGISAFGESTDSPILDENNRVIVGEIGFTEWLAWLQEHQKKSGLVFSSEEDDLTQQFLDGELTYLVGSNDLLSNLSEKMGDKLGVAQLPGRPLLDVYGMMLSANLTEEEIPMALAFSRYVTGIEAQEKLLEYGYRIPANVNVGVAEKPAIAGFARQAQQAIPIPNTPEIVIIWAWGDTAYEQVLDLGIDPEIAVDRFTYVVNKQNNLLTDAETLLETTQLPTCSETGDILLWHTWTEIDQVLLNQLIVDFAEYCPNIKVNLAYVPNRELIARYKALAQQAKLQNITAPLTNTETVTTTENITDTSNTSPTVQLETIVLPDFFLTTHEMIRPLVQESIIRNIGKQVSNDMLVDYFPNSIVAVRGNENLYGLPQYLTLNGLYYNTELIEQPALNTEELLEHTDSDTALALNVSFLGGIWGAASHDCLACQKGELITRKDEILITDEDLAGWRQWLRQAQATHGVISSYNQQGLVDLFALKQAAYLVAEPQALKYLQASLGLDAVNVGYLPLGEEGSSRPFMRVGAFMFSQETNDDQISLAMRFAQFANSQERQSYLFQEGNFIPTNSVVIAETDKPTMSAFAGQLPFTIVSPDVYQLDMLQTQFPLVDTEPSPNYTVLPITEVPVVNTEVLTDTAITGTVRLQNQSDYSGIAIHAGDIPCKDFVPDSTNQLATTSTEGQFVIPTTEGQTYQCLQAIYPRYLTGQKVNPSGNLGVLRLPIGDIAPLEETDNRINIEDMRVVVDSLGQDNPVADLTGNDSVDQQDLMILVENDGLRGPMTNWQTIDNQ